MYMTIKVTDQIIIIIHTKIFSICYISLNYQLKVVVEFSKFPSIASVNSLHAILKQCPTHLQLNYTIISPIYQKNDESNMNVTTYTFDFRFNSSLVL